MARIAGGFTGPVGVAWGEVSKLGWRRVPRILTSDHSGFERVGWVTASASRHLWRIGELALEKSFLWWW